MKKNLVLCLILAAAVASCKKSSSDDSLHLTCQIDGSAKTFNTGLSASKSTSMNNTAIDINGLTGTNGEELSLSIFNSGDITAKTYADTTASCNMSLDWATSATAVDAYEGGHYTWGQATAGSVTITHTVIKITAIDAQSVRGTFSGDLYLNDPADNKKKKVTSGDFYVKFQ